MPLFFLYSCRYETVDDAYRLSVLFINAQVLGIEKMYISSSLFLFNNIETKLCVRLDVIETK